MLRTSLDVVLRLRDDAERRALTALGAATQAFQAAHEKLEEARAEVDRDAPQHSGACGAWLVAISDHADQAALAKVRDAEQRVTEATRSQDAARGSHLDARAAQRVIARVVDAKREAHRRELDRREQNALDELAILRA